MVKSLCHLLMKVYYGIVANVYVTNMSFNAIRDNKILAKISELTVFQSLQIHLPFSTLLLSVFMPGCKHDHFLLLLYGFHFNCMTVGQASRLNGSPDVKCSSVGWCLMPFFCWVHFGSRWFSLAPII